MEGRMTLREKITQLCKQAEIEKQDLAKALGMAPSGLSVLSGKRPINHILIGSLTRVQEESGKAGNDFLDLVEYLKQ